MVRRSAGLLLHRRSGAGGLEVLLVHPGGPFWVHKDDGAWSIPKGEYVDGEEPRQAALREFAEELGMPPPSGEDVLLGEHRLPSGKRVVAWAREGDFDVAQLDSNIIEISWPPGSGRTTRFPEVDRAEWFTIDEALRKLHPGQLPFLDDLLALD